ncbi:MAG: hypothetical protein K5Q00_03365, partial [Gammaproteobacteria bacterium]|nr:hypothetical protein [Gammaproteobacteria bacterium]
FEQKYLLQYCNGRQLQPAGTVGDTCKIPLLFTYSSDPTQAKTTLTVIAVSDITPAPPATSASFTVDRTIPSPAKLTVYNVSNPPYRLRSGAQNPIENNNSVLVFYDASRPPPPPAIFAYTIQNTSTVAQTFTTRCNYQVNNDPNFPNNSLPTNITNNSCANMSLAPGASCSGSLTMNPNGCYACSAVMYLSVYNDTGGPVPPLNGQLGCQPDEPAGCPYIYDVFMFNGWNDP